MVYFLPFTLVKSLAVVSEPGVGCELFSRTTKTADLGGGVRHCNRKEDLAKKDNSMCRDPLRFYTYCPGSSVSAEFNFHKLISVSKKRLKTKSHNSSNLVAKPMYASLKMCDEQFNERSV